MHKVVCFKCSVESEDVKLHKCPVCFRHFCEEHEHRMSGRPFCSTGCAEYFFFAEPDD